MTGLAALTLLRPFWLLTLPAIIGLAFVWRNRRSGIGSWEKVIDPTLMQAMRSLGRVENPDSRTQRYLPFWAAGLIVLAVAGPALEKRDALAFRNLDGVVFVMDVSQSLAESPVWQNIVTMGRVGIAALGSKPAALIVYAGDAYVASAMTTDTHQIGQTMTFLDKDIVPDKGSRPALALNRAAQLLDQADIVAGDVVLMTDGGGFGPDVIIAAKTIAEQGNRLSVIHAPANNSGAISAKQMETLVSVGGGRLYGVNDGDALATDLGRNAWERLERQDYLLLFLADYGRYLLFLALIPVLGLFRRART